ncbi:hypothetical protein SARC_06957 [Sphaeroforma arctica JP610]|uniref:Uncharacterized protein n=1 Tax=Sphaeroforma arctica JP610 TaxID=667725 RepID=A0A0L0FXL8_9EUKA|nr:hypothetical protein SARC_06957 [Sphaeroforma arctica JP610]KNC80708.1 hypothetical protein SARC_06957 [Sphaeroforma arctica JP610]|eukprot:XP_014154610.1 hypothetical protein SARC_06957 [Sphaeroforma arctica JP610]
MVSPHADDPIIVPRVHGVFNRHGRVEAGPPLFVTLCRLGPRNFVVSPGVWAQCEQLSLMSDTVSVPQAPVALRASPHVVFTPTESTKPVRCWAFPNVAAAYIGSCVSMPKLSTTVLERAAFRKYVSTQGVLANVLTRAGLVDLVPSGVTVGEQLGYPVQLSDDLGQAGVGQAVASDPVLPSTHLLLEASPAEVSLVGEVGKPTVPVVEGDSILLSVGKRVSKDLETSSHMGGGPGELALAPPRKRRRAAPLAVEAWPILEACPSRSLWGVHFTGPQLVKRLFSTCMSLMHMPHSPGFSTWCMMSLDGLGCDLRL